MYKQFTDLNVGFSEAENYQRRENKELLEKYFVRDVYLDQILKSSTFFLVGEKGTGKTAYATFLKNNNYKENRVSIFNVRQSEYHKFLEIKKQGHLTLSQYAEIWRVLVLMAAATSILTESGTPEFLKRFTKLGALKRAIDEFYQDAFAPEIAKMLNFVEASEATSSLISKYLGLAAQVGTKARQETRDASVVFQTNLLTIRHSFELALSATKLENNVLLFIDGIDVRPSDIAYQDYFDCVRGLIELVWLLNSDFFGNIKDSRGRIRVVLLVRPDIFLKTGLHNMNAKLMDNSVFLNWITTYKDYRGSLLFHVADRLLSAQQDGKVGKVGDAWDYYFPFHAENVKDTDGELGGVNSFLAFLRFSYYRPRDISAMIRTMQRIVGQKKRSADYVTADDFNDPSFRDAHAEYLLGEIRDQILFYYSIEEFNLFLQFFLYLQGKRKFDYDEFVSAFNEFIAECQISLQPLPKFFETANAFLQFLYEQNVVCYKEHDIDKRSEPFIRWCFRERTLSNMAPKVRIGVEYEIFYGLSKALNVGRTIKVRESRPDREIGTIISVFVEKGFGFIRGGERQLEHYFKLNEYGGRSRAPTIGQKVSFEVEVKYGKLRARFIRPTR